MGEAKIRERLANTARLTWQESLPDHVRALLPDLDEDDVEWLQYGTTAVRFAELIGKNDIEVKGLKAMTVFCLAGLSLFKQMAGKEPDTQSSFLAALALVRGIGISTGLIATQFMPGEQNAATDPRIAAAFQDELTGNFAAVVDQTRKNMEDDHDTRTI